MGANTEIGQEVILFDGVCNLCNGAVNFVIDRDKKGRFKFASLQSQFAKERLRTTEIDSSKLDTIVLLKPDGRVKSKSSAALEIARRLSGLWPLLYVFIILPPFIRDWGYDLIAKNRYRWFGRTDQCRMPSKELLHRFIADA